MTERSWRNYSPESINSKLESKYKTSLFDISYLLAIALSGEFIKQKFYGMKKKELSGMESLLKVTKAKFEKYNYLSDLIGPIEDKLQSIRNTYIYKNKGIYLTEKTKLIFLWTQNLRKKRKTHHFLTPWKEESPRPKKKKIIKEIALKELPFSFEHYKYATEKDIEEGKEVIKAIDEESVVNWDNYYGLLNWFYERLKDCSYSSMFRPELVRKDEIRRSKLRLKESYWKYQRGIMIKIDYFSQAQEYFKKEMKRLPLKITYDGFIYANAYPIILINFKKDSIEIGEFRSKDIKLKKVKFINQKKVLSEVLIKDLEITVPTVTFPNGEKFVATNYDTSLI